MLEGTDGGFCTFVIPFELFLQLELVSAQLGAWR